MNTRYPQIVLIALIACITALPVFSQSADKSSTRLQVDYFKDHNRSERLVATLKIRLDQYESFENADVDFYTVNDTSKVLLEKIVTDKDGKAVYIINGNQEIFQNDQGMMAFEVAFSGDASAKGASKDIEVKPMDLKMSFFQEDSTKYIYIVANEIDTDNTLVPLEGQEIALYIKGMFSLLHISTEATDEDGQAKIEFPVNMPGDTLGVLTIVAKIEDSDTYGNVEAQGDINWAHPVPLAVVPSRGLGDTDAPLWMVYTLIILLSAVWFHYMYVVYLIVKIKLARSNVSALE